MQRHALRPDLATRAAAARTRLAALASIALLAAACAPVAADDDDDDSAVDDGPLRVDQFLQGTSTISFPGGPAGAPVAVLLHRILDPADNSLFEDIYQQEGDGSYSHFQVVGVIDAEAATWTFSFNDGFGTFEGEGSLFGDAWLWNAWESRSTYVDGPYVGSYVLSADETDDSGLHAEKQVFSPDDHLEADIVEDLDFVAEADWWAAVSGAVSGR